MAKDDSTSALIRDNPGLRLSSEAEVRALLTATQRLVLELAWRNMSDPNAMPTARSEAIRSVIQLTTALRGAASEAPSAWSGSLEDAVEGAIDVLQRVGRERAREAAERAGFEW